MEKQKFDEMNTTIRELNEFSKAAINLGLKLKWIMSQTVEWDNHREKSRNMAEQAQKQMDEARADAMTQINRLPNELAPLKKKIMEEERTANRLYSEAFAAKQEADEKLARANSLLDQAEKTVKEGKEEKGEPVAVSQAPRRGRPPGS